MPSVKGQRALVFDPVKLSDGLVQNLRRMNPWWEGRPLPLLPATRRHLVGQIKGRLDRRLAPIVVVRGPRQIGKTTAQLHLLSDLLEGGIKPGRLLRVQWDDLPEISALTEPVLRVVDWYEATILGQTLNQVAAEGGKTYLFFDEVQNLASWAEQLKALVDSSTTQVVVTGSSALRIEVGRDSLAGRISSIDAGVLSLTEIARFKGVDAGEPFLPDNGLDSLTRLEYWQAVRGHGRSLSQARDAAFDHFSERGGYPLAQGTSSDWPYVADQLNENVIRRVIQHDLRVGERGRKRDAALLEEVFRLACRYAGTSPGPDLMARETQRSLGANVGRQRTLHYLKFLGETLLLRLIEPLEIRLKRPRGHPKICLSDHALRASWLQEVIPLSPARLVQEPHLTDMAGRLAESVTGATLKTISQLDLSHYPSRRGEPEVDFVLTIGTRRVPLEVKYQKRLDPLRDTEGLRSFVENNVNNAEFGVLVTQADTDAIFDPRIVALPLSSLMLLR